MQFIIRWLLNFWFNSNGEPLKVSMAENDSDLKVIVCKAENISNVAWWEDGHEVIARRMFPPDTINKVSIHGKHMVEETPLFDVSLN